MRNLKTLMLVCMLLPISIRAEDKALLIGIGDYEAAPDLPGIHKDVSMMEAVVQKLGFQNVQVLLNHQVTYQRLRKALKALPQGITANDRVLVYFSGHGTQVPDDNADESDRLDEVLVAQDAQFTQTRENPLKNVLRDDEFGELLAAIPSQNIYVLIDACNSGTSTKSLDFGATQNVAKVWKYPGLYDNSGINKGSFRVEPVEAPTNSAKYVLLSAAQDDEYAQASPDGSYFTLGIYNAIMNLSDNDAITMRDLEAKTSDYIRRSLSASPEQIHRPNLLGEPQLWNQNMKQRFTDEVETLWDILERLVEDKISQESSQSLEIRTNRKEYRVGDLLTIECMVNMDGYINVLNVGRNDQEATVLYPNKYHKNNRVQTGTTIKIPGEGDEFQLPAQEPLGENLIVVFVSSDSLNAYEMDGKIADKFGLFGLVSKGSMARGFGVRPKPFSQWQAGKIITRVVK